MAVPWWTRVNALVPLDGLVPSANSVSIKVLLYFFYRNARVTGKGGGIIVIITGVRLVK